jgi:U3 small nucleolar RNA-associated protein 21
VTAHADDGIAHTWRAQEKRLGPWIFEVEDAIAQVYQPYPEIIMRLTGIFEAVCVTACGNFGLVGSSTGEIRMWNMQSGKDRKSFSLTGVAPGDTKSRIIAASKPKKTKIQPARNSKQAVTGLATDALNTMVVASTLEGKLYVRLTVYR